MLTFQDIILKLSNFWTKRGCVLIQPYDIEKGAGTFNPATFFRTLGPHPWRACFVEPARRPKDGRYGENPHRLEKHFQFQVILKPSPDDVLDIYFKSLKSLGIEPKEHDLRLDEDDWESPTLGAWGLGWQIMLDGTEITQFTYFQQMGGFYLDPITCEITYGLERIATFLQNADSIFDIDWGRNVKYGNLRLEEERQQSVYNFERADPKVNHKLFNTYEKEAMRLFKEGLYIPGYDFVLKCSHIFNILDARGVIGVTERQAYIGRVRRLARQASRLYLESIGVEVR
ncbi:MAG: glycine--tRNA ligase subunit alpha [bacterium]